MTKDTFRIAVMAVIVNTKNQVLIGSSPRDGGYKFPQGGLDPGEDVIAGVKRELHEELGIDLQDHHIDYLCEETVEYIYPPEDPYYIYKGQRLTVVRIAHNESMKLVPQDDEFEELLWINASELINFDVGFRTEAYLRALQLCGLL